MIEKIPTDRNQLKDDGFSTYPKRVIVKIRDEIPIPPGDDAGAMLEDYGIVSWYECADLFPHVRIDPLITDQQYQTIQDRIARAKEAEKLDPTYRQPAFLNFFVITVPLDQDPEAIVGYIKERWGNAVEYVYIRPLPAISPAVTPDDEGNIDLQGYMEPHNPNATDPADRTVGVDARYAWENYDSSGGDGQGVRFIDLEQGWFLNHIDLPLMPPPLYGVDLEVINDIPAVDNTFKATQKAHGTRSLGVVVAADNANLILGIAANADAMVVSKWFELAAPPVPGASIFEENIPHAILAAIEHLNCGDVLLLEVQLTTSEPNKFDPVELEPTIFNNIRLATALGIIVVEAAGNGKNEAGAADNGAYDLDLRPQLGTGIPILHRAGWSDDDALNYDSKAIIVGSATQSHPHQRLVPATQVICNSIPLTFLKALPSNYGSRVDNYAWGQCVSTIGAEGDFLSPNPNGTTSTFNGTSSASAIVAGVAVVTQAIGRQLPIPRLIGPELMRTILHDNGIASANPSVDRIGTMPNLRNIIINAL